jgi:mRNA-degrading endonuclease RelE of RelBE toxin-antitoxin system
MNLTETTNRRYRVELTDGARKDLKRLRQHREQIGEALGRLETNPLAGHALRGSLYNLRALEFTAKGSGAFRAVYGVLDTDAVCLVVIVGPHENIYDRAERRVEALRAAGII